MTLNDMAYLTHSEAWFTETNITRIHGRETAPRGMTTYERPWVQFSVDNPLTFPVKADGRKFADVIGVLEATALVGQFSVPELFTSRISKFAEFMDDGVFHGAYAVRAHGALGDIVNLLDRDPHSRQAVISVFDSTRDLDRAKRDIPCTIAIQFLTHGMTLEARTTMRSNDLWLGTPYDLIQFSVLQASVAQALGLEPGKYTHSVGSLHLYDRDLAKLEKVTEYIDAPPMAFPLWGCEDDIAEISARARALAFGTLRPETEFEEWARDLL